MDLTEHPAIAFRFERLKEAFAAFSDAIAVDDQERAFLYFLRFKTLAEMIGDGVRGLSDNLTHFDEEAHRVTEWMEYAVGLSDSAGYCSDQAAASFILDTALRWD